MLTLGTTVTETATGLKGALVAFQLNIGQQRYVCFQPANLNPEDGSPVKTIWVSEARIKGAKIIPDPPLPSEILGTQVEDTITGYKGTAISLLLFLSGCVHVVVQPKGANKKTNSPIDGEQFDIRRLKGSAIKAMSKEEIEIDKVKRPSPMAISHAHAV